MFSNPQASQTRWGIAFGTLLAYALAFFLLYPLFREGTAALAIIPVAVIAWLGGTRVGLLAGPLSFPVNTLLLNLVEPRAFPWEIIFQSGGGPGSLTIVLIGLVVGILRDQRDWIARELAQRQQAENSLSESEVRYRTLFESSQRQAQELELLDQVGQALARELELPLIFRNVVEGIAQTFGYTQVGIYLVEGDILVLQHQVGYDRVIERIPLTEGVAGRVVRSQQPMLLEDVNTDPAFLQAIEGITSEVCVPLFDQGQVAGVLNVESTGGVKLSEVDLRLMTALAAQVSIALGRARLYSEVRESEQRYKLMAWATKDAVWDWDLQTDQVWWGEGLQKIFHYSSEMDQTNSDWWIEHIHPEDRAKVDRTIRQALDGGMEFWSKEYRFQRKDRTYADIMDRGYILRDTTGNPYRIIGAMLDITERKYMESTLIGANEQMRQFLNELQGRNREIALLNEMSHLLQACQSEEEAYQIIADLSKQLFPRTTGALYRINAQRTLVSAVTSWGELPPAERMFAPDDCWAWQRGLTHPLREDQTVQHCAHIVEPLPAVSYCLPMQVQKEMLGVLHVRSQQEENLDEAKRQLAYTVVEQAGMAISNLKLREALREQSMRDPLTALYNRRYMEEALKQHISRVTRQLHPLAIIMIDIDHFKSFNDAHGHAAGDTLLRKLSQLLQSQIRGEDIACRYGGEEFILIMPDISLEVAQKRAEHLQREARVLQIAEAGQSSGGITLSMGIAMYPQHGRNIETVLRAADAALYRAKREGRDRVVFAE